jgi:hypothetical protein
LRIPSSTLSWNARRLSLASATCSGDGRAKRARRAVAIEIVVMPPSTTRI